MNISKLISAKMAAMATTPDWFKHSFPKQVAFIKDPSRFKIAHCTRRAGKSYGAGLYLVKEAYDHPGVSLIYIGLTRETAERIIWKDVLKVINRDFHLGAHFNDQKLVMTLPNGSVIYLMGADASKDEMAKLLGQKFKLAIIDEAAKYRIDIHALIFDILKPAVADYEGTIAMLGTANNFVGSYFTRAAYGRTAEKWSTHHWSALDNPYMRRQFQAEIDQLTQQNPAVIHEAWFRQNYLGESVVDSALRVYTYDPESVVVDALPSSHNMVYYLAVNISYKAGVAAYAVVGYAPDKSRYAYVVDAWTTGATDLHYVIEESQRITDKYKLSSIICVGASKQLTKEISSRFALSIEDASEKDRSDTLKLFCSELLQNNIKVFRKCSDTVFTEWNSVILDDAPTSSSAVQRRDLREHPLCVTHISSAILFAWRKCYNYGYLPITDSDDPMDRIWTQRIDELSSRDSSGPDIEDLLTNLRMK